MSLNFADPTADAIPLIAVTSDELGTAITNAPLEAVSYTHLTLPTIYSV